MKNLRNTIRSFFGSLGTKLKRKPKVDKVDAVDSASPESPRAKDKADRFMIISWVTTIFVVIALLSSTILYKNSLQTTIIPPLLQPTSPANTSGVGQPQVGGPVVEAGGSGISSILRELQLKTNIPERPRYESVTYRVSRGDAMMAIADDFKIKYETILYVNTQLDDNPHSLKPGMELLIHQNCA